MNIGWNGTKMEWKMDISVNYKPIWLYWLEKSWLMSKLEEYGLDYEK